MKQGIHPRAGLSSQELEGVRTLWDTCNEHDGIDIKLNWGTLSSRSPGITNDFLYYENDVIVGFLAIYSFLSTEVEISGMVHPAARRKGIFSALAQAAVAECRRRQVPKLIWINERGSAAGKGFVTQLGAAYAYSEYVMELRDDVQAASAAAAPAAVAIALRPAVQADAELLVALNAAGFGMPEADAREYVLQTLEGDRERTWIAELGEAQTPIGKIGAMLDPAERRGFIYGFCVAPPFRGQGYGRQILGATIALLQGQEQAKHVKLEVSVENEGALGLYESCGFRTTSANDYYVWMIG
ncbi:GNAT family N-acetyltransferase [Paenibacillus oryzisoli]|uniref:GNAT family N-acetyltransferase n=1 Tax=Paenibacillus oryzisoli TaxID=1850517 RepID=UPI003D2CAF3A